MGRTEFLTWNRARGVPAQRDGSRCRTPLRSRAHKHRPFESLLTLGSGRSVSLLACVDGFCDVFFSSVSQILDLSTDLLPRGCDLVQAALEFASEQFLSVFTR